MTSDSGKEETAMAGKLVIKARLGDDVRIIPIHNEDITYDELILMMQRVYRATLASSDDLTIKYQDDDGDLITMFDCADLSYALHASKVLKITLFPIPPLSKTKALLTEDGVAVRNELLSIRERLDHLLSCLEEDKRIQTAPVNPTTSMVTKSEDVSDANTCGRLSAKLAGLNEGKEFDPLSNESSSRGHTGEAYIPPINKPQQQSPPQQPQQQSQQPQQLPPQQQQSLPQQQPPQFNPQQQQAQQYPVPGQATKPPQASTTTSSAYPQPQYNSYPQNPPPSSYNNQPPSTNPSYNNQPPSTNPSYNNQPPPTNTNNYPSNPPPNNTNNYPSNPPPNNNYPPTQPPINNSYNNTTYPTSSTYQAPQPVQTGVQGGQYNQYAGYKGAPTSQPAYQPPFYPQSGVPPSPSNPYSRGATHTTQYPRPPLYPPTQ